MYKILKEMVWMVETGQCKMIERPCCSMSTAHFFQLYHGENMLDFDKTNMLYWIFLPHLRSASKPLYYWCRSKCKMHSLSWDENDWLIDLWCLTPLSTIFYWWRKPGILGENHQPDPSHWQNLLHNVVSRTPRHEDSLNS